MEIIENTKFKDLSTSELFEINGGSTIYDKMMYSFGFTVGAVMGLVAGAFMLIGDGYEWLAEQAESQGVEENTSTEQ